MYDKELRGIPNNFIGPKYGRKRWFGNFLGSNRRPFLQAPWALCGGSLGDLSAVDLGTRSDASENLEKRSQSPLQLDLSFNLFSFAISLFVLNHAIYTLFDLKDLNTLCLSFALLRFPHYFFAILSMTTREVGFCVDCSLSFETIKEVCASLKVLTTTMKIQACNNAANKVYSEFANKPEIFLMPSLRNHWVNPETGEPLLWSAPKPGEQIVLKSCKTTRLSLRKSHSNKKRKSAPDMLQPSSSQGSQQGTSEVTTEWDDARGEIHAEMDKIWKHISSFCDDLSVVESGICDVVDFKQDMISLVESQTKQGETVQSLGKIVSEFQFRISKMETTTDEASRIVAELQGKVATAGVAEMAGIAKTVEYLDASERSKNLVIFGWPVNSNNENTSDGAAVASSDAFHFLETVGVTEEHNLGRYSAVRRQARMSRNDADVAMGGSSDSPPPLVITFSDPFKAQTVLQAFFSHMRAVPGPVRYRAKIDTTPRERELQRATQPIVNILRAKGVDARYRSGGRIAKYISGNIFSNWMDKKDWPLPQNLDSTSIPPHFSLPSQHNPAFAPPAASSSNQPPVSKGKQACPPPAGSPPLFNFSTRHNPGNQYSVPSGPPPPGGPLPRGGTFQRSSTTIPVRQW